MTYRWRFPKDSLVKEEDGELVVYSEIANIQEPVSLIKFPNMSVNIKIHDGVNRPYIQVTTNKTADLAIDSKDASVKKLSDGYFQFHFQ